MRALVVYESVHGNTAEIARALGEGLGRYGEVTVADVRGARPEYVERFDLLVVGGPTRAFSLGRVLARGRGPTHRTDLTHGRPGIGLRDWLRLLPAGAHSEAVATFDVRTLDGHRQPGSTARRAAHVAQHLGYRPLDEPTSFFVRAPGGPLVAGERRRAVAFGERLAQALLSAPGHSPQN